MKTNVLATSFLLGLGLSVASAGQPNPRFYGIWVGVETYEIPAYGGANTQWGEAPVKKSAALEISDFGKTLTFGQGLLQGRIDISPSWGENTLAFSLRSSTISVGMTTRVVSGRNHGKLVLSADGNTLTETAVALLPGSPFSVTCNISGTFHRKK
jgi:hypothetical protein